MITPRRDRKHRRGFALIEAAVILVIGGALVSLLVVMSADTRRQARLGDDIAKLRQIGVATADYAADNSDLFWSFSWQKNKAYSQWPELNNATTDLQAAANQAVDILRRVAGREDISLITGWIPHLQYNHLVLEDYLRSNMPDRLFVSSMDKHRLKWSAHPKGFDQGLYQPAPSGAPGTNNGKRWPYSSSFQMPTCFYDASAPPNRITQATTHSTYFVPNGSLGGRATSAVAFPSGKVLYHDVHGRHFGTRVPYCAHPEARPPALFPDGGVQVRASVDANTGWHPNQPATQGVPTYPMQYSYNPDLWEPPNSQGAHAPELILKGYYRWTRGTASEHGIAGRDYDAAETCSGQPGCP